MVDTPEAAMAALSMTKHRVCGFRVDSADARTSHDHRIYGFICLRGSHPAPERGETVLGGYCAHEQGAAYR